MPSAALLQIERRLTELACPPDDLCRKIRELAEHHEDLRRDALEEGLSEAEAEARADALLGEPVALAEHLAASLRQSSWWGRHPIIGFCLLPLLATIPLMALAMTLEYWVGRLWLTKEQLGGLADWEAGLKYCRFTLLGTYYAVEILAAVFFCGVARQRVAGFKWACVACAMFSLHGALFFVNLAPHNITVGYANQMHWIAALLPLLIVLAVWLKARRSINRLPALPTRSQPNQSNPVALPPIPRSGLVTPSSTIATLIIVALGITIYINLPVHHHKAPSGVSKSPPAESSARAIPKN